MTTWFNGARPIETMSPPNSCVPRSTPSQFRTKRAILRSFYGNGGTKFPDKIQAVGKLAGSYEDTNTTGGNELVRISIKLFNVSLDGKLPAMRQTPLCHFKKKLVDQASLRYGTTRQPSDVGSLVLIDAVWSRNFERGEIVSPGGSIA